MLGRNFLFVHVLLIQKRSLRFFELTPSFRSVHFESELGRDKTLRAVIVRIRLFVVHDRCVLLLFRSNDSMTCFGGGFSH